MSTVNSVTETTRTWAEQRQIPTQFFAQTGSTNDEAKRSALSETDPLVLYVANHQMNGRGRGGNVWLDTGNGEALLSTWSFAVPSPPQAITGPRIGLALFTAGRKAWPSLSWGLKAPNDLFLSGHKVGGLLVESVTSGSTHRLIIGLGLNILNHPRKFTDATHLTTTLEHAPEASEWFRFLDELVAQFQGAVSECLQPVLSETACRDLAAALNANSARPFQVQDVTPQGDLIHDRGRVRWTEL